MLKIENAAAIVTGPATHLDHLGPLAALLQIPLIVSDEDTFSAAKKYYPMVSTIHKGFTELSLEYLSFHFDTLIHTGKFWSRELDFLFTTLCDKKMKLVYCPHGNSDKSHAFDNLHRNGKKDLLLAYGDHMIDLLKSTGGDERIETIQKIGNYRSLFYREHQPFYDDLAQKEVFSQLDPSNTTILYAPTWATDENPTSFFLFCDKLIAGLRDPFNLLIKLHPFLEECYPGETWHLIGKHEGKKNVLFLREFPPIYPLLNRCGIYLGDFSSIGYDFLYFDKPLFFFSLESKSSTWKGNYLHQSGILIPNDPTISIIDFIEQNWKTSTVEFRQKGKRSIPMPLARVREEAESTNSLILPNERRKGLPKSHRSMHLLQEGRLF